MKKRIIFLFTLISFYTCRSQTTQIIGTMANNAMIVSARKEASQAGIDILKKGGNAVDAAIAVQFALAVCYPDAGNLGGGGFMVLRLNTGETNTLDFREKAPALASRNMFLDSTGKVNRGWISASHLASGVPGSVDGMWTAYQKYATLKWETLIQPAINLAENGITVTEKQANEFNDFKEEFIKLNPGKKYLIKDAEWKAGDILIQKDLAETLKRIQQYGRDGFYDGPVADLLIKEMQNTNGIITKNDLINYHSVWRKPLAGNYKNYTIISMPPPSGGGVALLQLLKMVEPFPLQQYGFNSAQTIHVFTEAEKRVYADRATWLGDTDFFQVPVDTLVNEKYLQNRMKDFDEKKATPSQKIKATKIPGYESEETTHFSIVDAQGNAVAVTTTLNDSYGSKIFVNGAGFLLNNEMDDFSAKPGDPNLYGLIGGKVNSIAPGKRMLSNMTPAIILKDKKLFMVIGTPGGSTIANIVFQNILNVIEFNMTMQESVNAKRIHHQWLPDVIYYEKDAMEQKVMQQLKAMGYTLEERKPMGRVDAILIQDAVLEGAADPRGDDSAIGY